MNRRSLLAMLFGAAAVVPAAATTVIVRLPTAMGKTENAVVWHKLPEMYVMGPNGPVPITELPAPLGSMKVSTVNIFNESGQPVRLTKHRRDGSNVTDVIIEQVKLAMNDGRFDGILGPKVR